MAALALGLADRGRIAPGLRADLVVWNVARPGDLAYPLGVNPLAAMIRDGECVRGQSAMSDGRRRRGRATSRSRSISGPASPPASSALAPGSPRRTSWYRRFGLSRMTVNRALRELAADGWLSRRPGVGTFVRAAAGARQPAGAARHRRGHRSGAVAIMAAALISRDTLAANGDMAESFAIEAGAADPPFGDGA